MNGSLLWFWICSLMMWWLPESCAFAWKRMWQPSQALENLLKGELRMIPIAGWSAKSGAERLMREIR